jgi:eukaryotic-like serine/threonine-protein kinase
LTGKLPFEADTPWQWATQHMTAQPTPFEVASPQLRLPDQMQQAILKALAKDREQRQAGASQFINELSAGTGAKGVAESAAAVNAMPYQATAAMPEMPNFAASPAKPTAAVTPGAAGTQGMPATNASAMAGTPAPFIAAPPKRGGGKSGLVIGLVGGGVVIAAVAVVLLVRSNKPVDDPTITNPLASASASASAAAASIAPEVPTGVAGGVASPTPELTPPIVPASPQAVAHKASGKSTTASATSVQTSSSAHPTPSAAPSNPAPANTPAPTQPPAQNNAACTACISAAAAGDFATASRQYASCTDPALKSQCSNAARTGAIRAAKPALLAHDCNKLRAIATAVAGMSASSPQLTNAVNSCQ